MAEPDNALLLGILKEIRSELRDLRTLGIAHSEAFVRIGRRFDAVDRRFDAIDRRFEAVDHRFDAVEGRFRDLRDDLELMIRSESMGRAANFETLYDEKLAQLAEQISDRLKVEPI